MKRIKMVLKILVLLAVLLIPLRSVVMVRADSGWDTDYDSGSSYSGGHSWSGSDSSIDSSIDIYPGDGLVVIVAVLIVGLSIPYHHYIQLPLSEIYEKKHPGKHILWLLKALRFVLVFGFLLFIPVLVLIVDMVAFFILLAFVYKSCEKYGVEFYPDARINYYAQEKELLDYYLPEETMESLKAKLFDVFTDVQIAWMNFDYDGLRRLCSDELATTYIGQLEVLKVKNGQNIMSDFELRDLYFVSFLEENDIVYIKVCMKVSFYDYVINTNTKQVERGNKINKITNTYDLTFAKYHSNKSVKCPNCGALITQINDGVCPYCRTNINIISSNYILYKKEIKRGN